MISANDSGLPSVQQIWRDTIPAGIEDAFGVYPSNASGMVLAAAWCYPLGMPRTYPAVASLVAFLSGYWRFEESISSCDAPANSSSPMSSW